MYEYYNAGDDTYSAIWFISWRAQTFTVGAVGHTVTSVKLLLYRENTPGTVTVSIRATDADGHPTGADLTSGTIDGNSLTTDSAGAWYEIALTEYTLSASTRYAIVVRAPSGSGPSDDLHWRLDSTGEHTGGNCEYSGDSGGSWTSYTDFDFMFEVWGNAIVRDFLTVVFGPH